MKRHYKSSVKAIQRGFTLLELAVVVSVIGILIAILAPSLFGSTDGAKAQNYFSAAQKISSNLMMLSQTAGVSTGVAGNPLIAPGNTIEDVLFTGSSAVNAPYQGAYARSKVLPLSEIGSPAAGGGWEIGGAKISITGGGTVPLGVSFAGATDSIVLNMVQKYSPTTTALNPAGATVSAQLSYGPVVGGATTVTVYKIVN